MPKFAHQFIPWNIPVPLKKSNFFPFYSSHSCYNVETDLSQIPSFSYRKRQITRHLTLFADLQTNLDANVFRRLGSGRSGFYRGKYLKGVGITNIAGNWLGKDSYHNSGHLSVSNASREFLVSKIMEAKKLEETIVPCQGILIRPLDPRLKDISKKIWPKSVSSKLCASDNFIQAISVKPGNFCRISNINWLLNHTTSIGLKLEELSLATFFETLAWYVSFNPNLNTPAEIVEALFKGLERVITNIMTHHIEGINWQSYHNNWTIDGRFLDLELPLILTFPFFGIRKNGQSNQWVGLEFVQVEFQINLFINYLVSQIRFISKNVSKDLKRQRKFLNEFGDQLEHKLRSSTIIGNRESLRNLFLIQYSKKYDLTVKQKAKVERCILATQHRIAGEYYKEFNPGFKLVKLPIKMGITEANIRPTLWVPEFCIPDKMSIEPSQEIQSLLYSLDQHKDIDSYFENLKSTCKNVMLILRKNE